MGAVRKETKETKMVHKVRRQDGRSVILRGARGQRQRDNMESMPGLTLTDPWETATAPRRATPGARAAARPVRLEPPQNGTILRIVEFPPRAVCARETCLRGVTPAES
jgi:hypothetical protein